MIDGDDIDEVLSALSLRPLCCGKSLIQARSGIGTGRQRRAAAECESSGVEGESSSALGEPLRGDVGRSHGSSVCNSDQSAVIALRR